METEYNAGLFTVGICHCGKHLICLQNEVLANKLQEAVPEDFIVVVLSEDQWTCPNCGATLNLPPAEILDIDRLPYGRWLEDMLDEL